MSITQITPTEQELQHEVDRLTSELASLRDSGVELPEPDIDYADYMRGYTESQLRDYGDRRAMAERERAAKICESEWETSAERAFGKACAEAIRKGDTQ